MLSTPCSDMSRLTVCLFAVLLVIPITSKSATVGFEFNGTIKSVGGPSTYSNFGLQGSVGDAFSVSITQPHNASPILLNSIVHEDMFGGYGGTEQQYVHTTFPQVSPLASVQVGSSQLNLDSSFFVLIEDQSTFSLPEYPQPLMRLWNDYQGPDAPFTKIPGDAPAGDIWWYHTQIEQTGDGEDDWFSEVYTFSSLSVVLVFEPETFGEAGSIDFQGNRESLAYALFSIGTYGTFQHDSWVIDEMVGVANLGTYQPVPLPSTVWLFVSGFIVLKSWRPFSQNKFRAPPVI